MTETILVERDGAIATVILNRPEKLNALTRAMWRRLGEIIESLSADDDLRCVVLRGAGGKAFAAGADIGEFETERANRERAGVYAAEVGRAIASIQACRHPTLALIEGACVGGGLEVAAFCDMRICGESSSFGVPIKRLGLVVGYEELRGLIALVGRAATLEILLEGRVFGADEALRMGLVNRVVPDGEVEEEAYATARRIAEGAPLVARWHKRFVKRLDDPAPLTDAELEETLACYDTDDFRRGYQAFLAKKKPDFTGR
ncbi:MAG: enoyl-CoA hydratase/isomerase family protein [Proteobacteria bacterium]|nr:enoyl-CoA hydratase/isomerase family protein [Pseudomonadota bacterium]